MECHVVDQLIHVQIVRAIWIVFAVGVFSLDFKKLRVSICVGDRAGDVEHLIPRRSATRHQFVEILDDVPVFFVATEMAGEPLFVG